MNRAAAIFAFALCCSPGIHAQSVPDFSGKWTLDAPNDALHADDSGGPRPSRIKYVKAIHPYQGSKAWMVAGAVEVEAFVNEIGDIADAVVTRSVRGLDRAALDAVRQWKYTPILRDGVPVPVVMRATTTFSLTGVEPTPSTPTGDSVMNTTIKQNGRSLTLNRHTARGPETIVLHLDGTESRNHIPTRGGGTAERVLRSHWEGARLVTTTTTPFQVETRYLEGATMVVETVTPSAEGGEPKVTKNTYHMAE